MTKSFESRIKKSAIIIQFLDDPEKKFVLKNFGSSTPKEKYYQDLNDLFDSIVLSKEVLSKTEEFLKYHGKDHGQLILNYAKGFFGIIARTISDSSDSDKIMISFLKYAEFASLKDMNDVLEYLIPD
ncbi:MAG: hypothetical protein U0L98_00975 [Clostridia bacterium]|nr:hypothetical protein [Clostridia bacterium]